MYDGMLAFVCILLILSLALFAVGCVTVPLHFFVRWRLPALHETLSRCCWDDITATDAMCHVTQMKQNSIHMQSHPLESFHFSYSKAHSFHVPFVWFVSVINLNNPPPILPRYWQQTLCVYYILLWPSKASEHLIYILEMNWIGWM